METLKQKHEDFMNRYKSNGYNVVTLCCPLCNSDIETPAAPEGETWDSISNCPECEGLYFKYATNDRAWGVRWE